MPNSIFGGYLLAEHWQKLLQAGRMTRRNYEDSSNPPYPEHIPPIIPSLCTDQAAIINGHVLEASPDESIFCPI